MQITKFGHCCLLIEINGKRILTDPGSLTIKQNELNDLDLILITHEHGDHLHTESLAKILKNNPQAKIITNSSVGKILETLDIKYEVLEGMATAEKAGIVIEAHDGKHAEIFKDYGQVQNTGYFIADKLFYPGDAYTEVNKPVEILALPVSGPWCKISDALTYAIKVKPKIAFPVHDWLLNQAGVALTYGMFQSQLQTEGIKFVELGNDEVKEF